MFSARNQNLSEPAASYVPQRRRVILIPCKQSGEPSFCLFFERNNSFVVIYYNAHQSVKRRFNVRFIAATPNNMIIAFILQSKSGGVVYLAFSTYKSSQNLYFVEKNSLQNMRSCACFQLGVKICLSTPRTLFLKTASSYFDSLKTKQRAVFLPVL